ncbi:MAG: alcohol dehydrogenase catalytic domain-containing protein [Thermoanaerobacteraceae bacterium]|nr:alcohol dehydrogenase catalytic domain-containing protein [Thermoanaerobacteraceae bacterium]
MKRATLIRPRNFRIEEVPIPAPEPNHLLIRVKICGICGSDIHAFHGTHPFISCPIVLGHEFAGMVVATGESARDEWKEGDRVIVEPSLTCGRCYNCRIGRYNICDDLKVIGCQSDGAFAEFLVVPVEKVIRLDEKLTYEEGALVEPLAVGVHAVDRAEVKEGQSVLIHGAGTIGLMVLQAAKARGATVIISDVLDTRLVLAKELGADYTINVSKEPLDFSLKDVVPEGPDVILECSGTSISLQEAIRVARKGSRIVLVGVIDGLVPLPVSLIQDRELELVGDLMYTRQDFVRAQELIVEGQANVKRMISRVFPLDEVDKAFRYLEDNKKSTIKVLVSIS